MACSGIVRLAPRHFPYHKFPDVPFSRSSIEGKWQSGKRRGAVRLNLLYLPRAERPIIFASYSLKLMAIFSLHFQVQAFQGQEREEQDRRQGSEHQEEQADQGRKVVKRNSNIHSVFVIIGQLLAEAK